MSMVTTSAFAMERQIRYNTTAANEPAQNNPIYPPVTLVDAIEQVLWLYVIQTIVAQGVAERCQSYHLPSAKSLVGRRERHQRFLDDTSSDNFVEYEVLVARCPTFDSFWEVCDRPQWMLHTLRHSDSRLLWIDSLELRSFACWCARNALSAITLPVAPRLIETAEEFIVGSITKGEMLKRQEDVGSGASGAGAVGLPKLFPNAAALLACDHTCGDSAVDAAEKCSAFSARTVRYVLAWECYRVMLKDDSPDYQVVISVAEKGKLALDVVTSAALATQAQKLREIIPRPEQAEAEMSKLEGAVIPRASRKVID